MMKITHIRYLVELTTWIGCPRSCTIVAACEFLAWKLRVVAKADITDITDYLEKVAILLSLMVQQPSTRWSHWLQQYWTSIEQRNVMHTLCPSSTSPKVWTLFGMPTNFEVSKNMYGTALGIRLCVQINSAMTVRREKIVVSILEPPWGWSAAAHRQAGHRHVQWHCGKVISQDIADFSHCSQEHVDNRIMVHFGDAAVCLQSCCDLPCDVVFLAVVVFTVLSVHWYHCG